MLQASLSLYRNAFSGIPKPVWWLSLVMLVNRSGTMVIPFLTVYLTERGYTLAEAGGVMAAFGVGAFLGGFIGGKGTDKFGFFRVQVVSLLASGLLFILLAYMNSLVQITVCIFALATFGEAFRPANAAAIGAYTVDANRTRSYSLNRLAINLGWAIGPAVGGILASIDYSWLFWVDGSTCIGASLLLYAVFGAESRRTETANNDRTRVPASSVYRDTTYLLGMFFLLLIAICFFQLFSIIPVFYKDEVALNEAEIGIVLAANGLLIVLVEMVLVYKLERRKNPVLFIMLGALLMGVSFLLLAIAPVLAWVILSMVVITFGEMLLFPFTNDFWVSRTNSSNRGQYAAVYTMTFALAHVLSPLLSSKIAFAFGYSTLFIIDFLVCSIGAAGFLWLKNRRESYGKL